MDAPFCGEEAQKKEGPKFDEANSTQSASHKSDLSGTTRSTTTRRSAPGGPKFGEPNIQSTRRTHTPASLKAKPCNSPGLRRLGCKGKALFWWPSRSVLPDRTNFSALSHSRPSHWPNSVSVVSEWMHASICTNANRRRRRGFVQKEKHERIQKR